jgi:hypothetical protein
MQKIIIPRMPGFAPVNVPQLVTLLNETAAYLRAQRVFVCRESPLQFRNSAGQSFNIEWAFLLKDFGVGFGYAEKVKWYSSLQGKAICNDFPVITHGYTPRTRGQRLLRRLTRRAFRCMPRSIEPYTKIETAGQFAG